MYRKTTSELIEISWKTRGWVHFSVLFGVWMCMWGRRLLFTEYQKEASGRLAHLTLGEETALQ